MSIETSKKKKGIQMPHTYIILFLIVLVVCLLTYVIPAGQFERQEDASGRMLIVPGTYTQVESSPVSPLERCLREKKSCSSPSSLRSLP